MPDNQGHLRALERFLCGLPNQIRQHRVAELNSAASTQPSERLGSVFDSRARFAARDYQLPFRKTEGKPA